MALLGVRTARLIAFRTYIFHTHFRNDFESHKIYELEEANDIMSHEKFVPSQKTAIYVHGYVESPAVESIHVIVDAYQKRGDHNLIVLDWGELANGNYIFDAVINAKQVKHEISVYIFFINS